MSNVEPQHSLNDTGSAEVVRKLQLVRAGSSQFAISADNIFAVVAWQTPTPLPHAPKSVLGVVSIQGRMLTVLDLVMLPGSNSKEAPHGVPAYIIALQGDEQLALAVDDVGGIIHLADSDLEGPPGTVGSLIEQVLEHEGVKIHLLNLKKLFPNAIQGRERRRRRF